jgi:hypothetical protein
MIRVSEGGLEPPSDPLVSPVSRLYIYVVPRAPPRFNGSVHTLCAVLIMP